MSIGGTDIRRYPGPVASNPARLLHPTQLVPGWDGRRVPLTETELLTAARALWNITTGCPSAGATALELRTTDFTNGVGLSWILSGVVSTLLDSRNRTTLVQLTLARHFRIRPCYREGMSGPLYPVQYLGYRMIRDAHGPLSELDIGALTMHLSELRANFPKLFPSADR